MKWNPFSPKTLFSYRQLSLYLCPNLVSLRYRNRSVNRLTVNFFTSRGRQYIVCKCVSNSVARDTQIGTVTFRAVNG